VQLAPVDLHRRTVAATSEGNEMHQSQTSRTLLGMAASQRGAARWPLAVAAGFLGVCLLTLSAKVQVPFWPVPMTLQTLVVLMLGMSCGARLAAATVVAYLLAGAAGLPVLAGTPERGIGLAYMMGPTAGFLVGFVLAAWLVGVLAERDWDRSFLRCAAAMVLGHAVITLSGLAWLAVLFGTPKAIEVGLMPFLASSALKTALGAVSMPMLWRLLAAER
jgi:biotin transport system substrate-specific component